MGLDESGASLAGDGDYGPPSDLPWAMAFPNGTVPTNVPVHPTPLYETGMSLIGFGLLWSIRKQKEGTPGWLLGGAFILAGIERFIAEFFRLNQPALFGLTGAQLTSVLIVIIGAVFSTGSHTVPLQRKKRPRLHRLHPPSANGGAVIRS